MNLGQAFAILPLVAAAAYSVLLIALVVRTALRNLPSQWFLAVLVSSILWSLALFLLPNLEYTRINSKLFASVATLLGATTAVYVGWRTERRWLLMGGVPLLLALVLDVVWRRPPWLEVRYGAWRPSFGEFIGFSTWLTLHLAILGLTWRDYRRTVLPWHANRLLHWIVFAMTIAFGEMLTLMPTEWLSAFGQGVRFIGIVGLFRATTSHRLFDVRARLRKALAFALVSLFSAIPAAIVLTISLWISDTFQLGLVEFYGVAMVVIAGGFVLYQPFRRVLERMVYRYLVGREFQTSKVVRQYNRAISRTLEIEQLAQVIIGTISDLVQTTRGAVLLVSPSDDGFDVELIPGQDHQLPDRKLFPPDSQFINTLIEERRPLLQYDLDFNPYYKSLTADERQWLAEQNMDVYVPIHDGDRLDGLIALGPKTSGLAYRANELELVQVLAEQTAIALQNARLYSELNRQNERIRSLNTDLRLQNERLAILDRMKSDFITIASHELRTPLTQVKGYTDILTHLNENGPLDQEKTRDLMGHISRASSRLETLITAMLDASELEVSGMQLMQTPARLSMIIENAVAPLEQALSERNIHLQCEGLEDIPPLDVDFERLVQAFGNVLGNAVKYTPDHGVITVSASVVPGAEDNQNYVEIVIADTGIGIDPQYHDLIFEKFFRIGNPELHSTGATKFKGGGPGLGLHIAKGVVETHGGHIWVESSGEDEEELPGSRFYIVLPLKGEWRLESEVLSKVAAT